MPDRRLGYREKQWLTKMIAKNDIFAKIQEGKDGIKEIVFDSTEEELTLKNLKEFFREFTYDRGIITNHPYIQMGEEISEIMGIPIINARLPNYLNGEQKIHLEKSVKGKQLIIVGSRVRSFCDDPLMEKRFYSPSDNYDELMDILQSILLARDKATTAFLLMPYVSCAKKDKKEGRDHLPIGKISEDMERYSELIEEIIWPFMHARGFVSCFRRFGVEDIEMAPSYARVIELIISMRKLEKKDVRIVALDDSGVKKSSPIADATGIELTSDLKRRLSDNLAVSLGGTGDIKGKIGIVTDDLVQSGSTFIKGSTFLKSGEAHGAIMIIGGPDFTYNREEKKWAHEIALGQNFFDLLVFFDTTPLISLLRQEAIRTGNQDKVIVVKSATLFALYLWRKMLIISCDDLRCAEPKRNY